MHSFLEGLVKEARKEKKTIVLAEAEDERVIRAAQQVYERKIATLILVGDEDRITRLKKRLKTSFDYPTIDPSEYETDFSQALYKARNGRLSQAKASTLAKDPRYFAALLVKEGLADGALSGNQSTTKQTLKAALQVIGTPNKTLAFSYFLMLKKGHKPLLFGDCALNTNPDEKELAVIAKGLSQEAARYNLKARVAMLSYSTRRSGEGPDATLVQKATSLAKRRGVDAEELQFDAAINPGVAKKKAKDSLVAGRANAFVFPSLTAGNIGYKIAERLGGWSAIGPIVCNLKKPMHDLSRGCSEDDIVAMVLLTALQQ